MSSSSSSSSASKARKMPLNSSLLRRELRFERPDWFTDDDDNKPKDYCGVHYFCQQLQDSLQIFGGNNKKKNNRYEQEQKVRFMDIPWVIKHHQKRTASSQNRTVGAFYYDDDNVYDLQQLLSSPTRDFLVKYGDNHHHKVNQLSGKHVVLYIGWPRESLVDFFYGGDVRQVYGDLHPKGLLEVVFVALGDDESLFHSCFSDMPWLAIPFQDFQARNRINDKFDFLGLARNKNSSPKSLLFAPDGTLLDVNCSILFHAYGAQGFPFTRERLLVELPKEDADFLDKFYTKQLSLPQLLGDHVISPNGDRVLTSNLNGKTLGLHFIEDSSETLERTRDVLKIWKSLMGREGINFEIVVIYMQTYYRSVGMLKLMDNEFGKLPWYTMHGCSKRLCRVFKLGKIREEELSKDAGYLIIVEANESRLMLNYFALNIFRRFGVEAYPFTLEKAVSLRKNQLEELRALNKLLSPLAPLRRGCPLERLEADIVLSKLSSKRVFLLFATYSSYKCGHFLLELNRFYSEMRDTSDHFEIIYMSVDCDSSASSFSDCIQEMPWLIHAKVPTFATDIISKVFDYFPTPLPAIAAFTDGKLVGKEDNLIFKQDWSCAFPFVKQYSVEEEVREEFKNKFKWDLDLYSLRISSTNS